MPMRLSNTSIRLLLLISLCGAAFGQVTTYNLNNDSNVHTFTTPLPCPSTNAANCSNSGTQNNQALVGANSIWAECDFSQSSAYKNPECASAGGAQVVTSTSPGATNHRGYVHIVRATDANTHNAGTTWSATFGGAGDVVWDKSATRLTLINQAGGIPWIFSFDPEPSSSTYMHVTPLYGGMSINTYNTAFSKVTPYLWYTVMNSSNVTGLVGTNGVSANEYVLMSYDFTSSTTAPTFVAANTGTIKLIVDFNVCLTGIPAYNSTGVLSVSDDDTTFETDPRPANSGQDTGSLIVVYNKTRGCAMLNTATATVTKFGGGTATVTNANAIAGYAWPPETYIHETQIYHDGGKIYYQGSNNCCVTYPTVTYGYCSGATLTSPGTCSNGATGCINSTSACYPTGCVNGNNCDGQNVGAQGVGAQNYVWETGIPFSGNSTPPGTNLYLSAQYNNGTFLTGAYVGHSMQGYNLWINEPTSLATNNSAPYMSNKYNDSSVSQQIQVGPVYNPGSLNCWQNGTPYTCPYIDQHTSWANNIDGTDKAPFFSITWEEQSASQTNNYYPDTPQFVLGDEILIMPMSCYPNCAGNVPWRVTHTFSTPEYIQHAVSFADFIAIGSVTSTPFTAADGSQYHFVAFTSNWEDQLGCQNGSLSNAPWYAGCPNTNTGGRFDAFIASVPIAGGTIVTPPTNLGVTITSGIKLTSGTQIH